MKAGNNGFGLSMRHLRKWLSALLLVVGLVATWGVAGNTRAMANTGSPTPSWQSVGSVAPSIVKTLLYVNGTLYAGTDNSSPDVWSYSNGTWTPMSGAPGSVQALLYVNGTLYAGTYNSGNAVWSYDGTTWTQMGSSPSHVTSLVDVNGTLYAGTGNGSNDVWSYNNGTWTQMGSSPSNVNSLVDVNGTLYAGTGNGSNDVWSYNNGTWTQMGSSPSNVNSLANVSGTLYAGTNNGSNDVWSYSNGTWAPMSGSPSHAYSLVDVSGTLYVPTQNGSNDVWSYSNGTWAPMSGSPSYLYSLVYVNGTLYAGGGYGVFSLQLPPGAPTNVLASKTTSSTTTLSWSPVVDAISYNVYENGGTTPIATGITSPTYTVSGLKAGTGYSFTVTAVNANGESAQSSAVSLTTNYGSVQFIQPYIDTVEITTTSTVGQPFSEQLIGGGASIMTWSVVKGSLPSGLILSSQGVISGTPTTAGTSSFTVQIADTNGKHATMPLSMTVSPSASSSGVGGTSGGSSGGTNTGTGTASVPLAIGTELMPTGLMNAPYSSTLSATGGQGSYIWSVVSGVLPAGLLLDAKTGTITGTPKQTGLTKVTIKVSDANGQVATKALGIDILPANARQWVWNGKAQDVPVIVEKDFGTETTYMPIWYVMQLLKQVGVNSVWDGHAWHLTTTKALDLTNLTPGQGQMGIYLNGTLVQKVNGAYAKDPSTGENTTYMPIWYVMQILNKLSVQSNWNGTTWSLGAQGNSTNA